MKTQEQVVALANGLTVETPYGLSTIRAAVNPRDHKLAPGFVVYATGDGGAGSDKIAMASLAAELAERREADRWRDPATEPPPSGVELLAYYRNDYGKTRRVRAEYAAPRTLEVSDGCEIDGAEYDEAEDKYWCPPGWYEWNEHEDTHWAIDEVVLGWRQLPALPEPFRVE